MDLNIETAFTPILDLKTDIENFLEAIDPEPNSELYQTGYQFTKLLNELHQLYTMEFTVEHMESCFYSPDYIKPTKQS